MVPGAKIIVEPHARLIVDGGHLTNAAFSGDFWQGIEVWGTRSQNQQPIEYPLYQGRLETKNGAIIENAKNAIAVWHPGDWNSMGGVVNCYHTTFRNNRRSVEFMSYQNTNYSGTAPGKNLSHFRYCTFIADEDYMSDVSPFYAHVSMWDVDGVAFTGCNFISELEEKAYTEYYRNKGIHSVESGYEIWGGSFHGFNYAIDAKGAISNNRTVRITWCEFTENGWGFYANTLNNFSVEGSDFEVGLKRPTTIGLPYIGIHSVQSTGYTVRNNDITQTVYSGMQSLPTTGIKILNSGKSDNYLRKNNVSGLSTGIWAVGKNRDHCNPYKGLRFICNNMSENRYQDIAVSKDTIGKYHGICEYQKRGVSVDQDAGNTFSSSTGNGFHHIKNESGHNIYYYLAGNGNLELFGPVTIRRTPSATPCSFSYGGWDQDSISGNYETAVAAYNTLRYVYDNLIDAGNTEWLIKEIQMAFPENAMRLRDQLLSISPFLSAEVLYEAASQNVLTHVMLLTVCLANPDISQDEDFMGFMQEGMSDPMPDYMVNLILNAEDSKTARSILEAEMSEHRGIMTHSADQMLTLLMTDSIKQRDQIRFWLERKRDLRAYYDLAASYMEENLFTEAALSLKALPNVDCFGVGYDNPNLETMTNYIGFRQALFQDERSIAQLTEQEIDELILYTEGEDEIVASAAQNILCFFYGICDDKHTPLPIDDEIVIKSGKANNVQLNAEFSIQVFPNPADSYTTIEWEFPSQDVKGNLVITDIVGNVIVQERLSSQQGQWLWDTRNINNGTYIYKVTIDNKKTVSGKIVVNK